MRRRLYTSNKDKAICSLKFVYRDFPAGIIYLLKVNYRNARAKVWNMFKVNNKATKTMAMASFWWLYC